MRDKAQKKGKFLTDTGDQNCDEISKLKAKNEKYESAGHRRAYEHKSIQSTQQALPILDVRDDIVVMKDGACVKLMEFSPINFELRAPHEQDAIIAQFGSVIRTWPKDVHIKVITSPSNVSDFIHDIAQCMLLEDSEECRKLQQDQIEMLERISQTQGVTRRFLVSFPFEDTGGLRKTPSFEEIKLELDRQARSIQLSMESCGNALISIDEKDYTLSVLYNAICKSQSDAIPWEIRKEAIDLNYQEQFGPETNLTRIPVADYLAPDQIELAPSPNYIIIDGKYTSFCYLPSHAYPVQVYGGWLQILFSYMDDVNIDFWIHKEAAESIQRRLQFELKSNRIKQKSTDDISTDYEEIISTLESGYYIKQALANGDDFCYISTMITIHADSAEELNEKYRERRA